MNHIHKLQKDARDQRAEIEALRAGITRVIAYVNSTKFACGDQLDGYVSIKDISVRLQETLSAEVI